MDVRRRFWIAFGAASQGVFAVTVVRLFLFLQGGEGFRPRLSPGIDRGIGWVAVDSLLALQFAVLHSAMLWPPVRAWLNRRMPSALAGCFFCATTCLSLFVTMEFWRTSPSAIWHATGSAARIVSGLFLASWVALTYSLWLTGFGYQTGFTTWRAWARGRETPRRSFAPTGAYKLMRHPVYLSFLGLVWFNPMMTADRLVLALWWTAHILVGSYLKDRRLEQSIGEPYRRYQVLVPGYPLLTGPLGRRRPGRPATSRGPWRLDGPSLHSFLLATGVPNGHRRNRHVRPAPPDLAGRLGGDREGIRVDPSGASAAVRGDLSPIRGRDAT